MFNRAIEEEYKEYASVYSSIVDEAEATFKKHGKSLTVFHKILIDRVADGYVANLMVSSNDQATDKKVKQTAAELKNWLTIALTEDRNAEAAVQSRRVFYEKVVEVLEDRIPDETQRRDVLKALRNVVEE